MIVTDKQYSMDKFLVEKLDLMCERVVKHKFDNLIIIDGGEGYGKSNLASAIAYYLAWKSGRPFSVDNVFFLVDDMINFAVKTKEQVIWWDEAALGGLASESYNRIQTKLLKLLMVARKKQHFYIFVIPKYFKLREPIIDRAIALLHVYSRDGITRGRFGYYGQNSKEKMYEYWRTTKYKGYGKFFSFLGTFGETLPLIIDEKIYDCDKDAAIMTLGNINDPHTNELARKDAEINKLRTLYASLNKIEGINQEKLAEYAGITSRTLRNWQNPKILGPDGGKVEAERRKAIIINEVPTSLDGDGNQEVDNDAPSSSPIVFDDGHDDDSPIVLEEDEEEP